MNEGLSGRTGIMRSAVAVSTTGYAKALGLGASGVLLKVKQSLEWTGWEAMHQQEATKRVLVQRVGEMGGMIQFTQVEPEKHFISGEVEVR